MNQSNYQPPSQPPSPSTQSGASSLAILSLVLGVASWVVLPLFGAIMAVVTGKMELSNIAAGRSSADGKTFATLGFWLGAIQTALWAFSCIVSAVLLVAYFVFGVAIFGFMAAAQ